MGDKLKSEISFPVEERRMARGSSEYDLVLNYSTALVLAESDLKEANKTIEDLKKMKSNGASIIEAEKKLKNGIVRELKEFVTEPEGTYEEGHNGGINLCVSHINKLDIVSLLKE